MSIYAGILSMALIDDKTEEEGKSLENMTPEEKQKFINEKINILAEKMQTKEGQKEVKKMLEDMGIQGADMDEIYNKLMENKDTYVKGARWFDKNGDMYKIIEDKDTGGYKILVTLDCYIKNSEFSEGTFEFATVDKDGNITYPDGRDKVRQDILKNMGIKDGNQIIQMYDDASLYFNNSNNLSGIKDKLNKVKNILSLDDKAIADENKIINGKQNALNQEKSKLNLLKWKAFWDNLNIFKSQGEKDQIKVAVESQEKIINGIQAEIDNLNKNKLSLQTNRNKDYIDFKNYETNYNQIITSMSGYEKKYANIIKQNTFGYTTWCNWLGSEYFKNYSDIDLYHNANGQQMGANTMGRYDYSDEGITKISDPALANLIVNVLNVPVVTIGAGHVGTIMPGYDPKMSEFDVKLMKIFEAGANYPGIKTMIQGYGSPNRISKVNYYMLTDDYLKMLELMMNLK